MDLSFHTEQGRFNYRVGALIFQDEKLLLATNDRDAFYYPVGGRVKYGETCEEAVLREVREELGIHLEIDRVVFFCEYLYNEQVTNERFHEIGIYFLMRPSGQLQHITEHSFWEDGEREYLRWIPINQLSEHTVFPRFLKTELSTLPGSCKLIIDKS